MWPSVALAALLAQLAAGSDRVLDLSHPYDMRTLSWPTLRRFEMRQRESNNGTYYLVEDLHMATHTGTHLDAPCHFARGRWCVTEIPLERLVDVPAVIVDVHRGQDAVLTPEDLEAWESEHGSIPPHAVVIMRAGWSSRYPDRREYFGTDIPNSTRDLRFPGFSPEAAQWIAEHTEAAGLGTDGPSIDPGRSKTFPAHVTLARSNVYNLENLADLSQLPPSGAKLTILPMKLAGASGAPARVIARIPSACPGIRPSVLLVSMLLVLIFLDRR